MEEARSITQKPKSIIRGRKTFHILGTDPDHLFIVEDLVSAIKLSQYTSAFPLFGSSIKKEFYPRIAKFRSVVLWLDYDKYPESLKQASRLRLYVPNIVVAKTFNDPKNIPHEILKQKVVQLCEDLHSFTHP